MTIRDQAVELLGKLSPETNAVLCHFLAYFRTLLDRDDCWEDIDVLIAETKELGSLEASRHCMRESYRFRGHTELDYLRKFNYFAHCLGIAGIYLDELLPLLVEVPEEDKPWLLEAIKPLSARLNKPIDLKSASKSSIHIHAFTESGPIESTDVPAGTISFISIHWNEIRAYIDLDNDVTVSTCGSNSFIHLIELLQLTINTALIHDSRIIVTPNLMGEMFPGRSLTRPLFVLPDPWALLELKTIPPESNYYWDELLM